MIWKISLLSLLFPLAVFAAPIETYTARLPIGDWQPSVADVVSALDYLKHDYGLWLGKRATDVKPWREYRFQYYGIRKKGRKIVYLNAFCSSYWDEAQDWRTKLVLVMDGGSCFFHAKFDVDSAGIISVVMNGEA